MAKVSLTPYKIRIKDLRREVQQGNLLNQFVDFGNIEIGDNETTRFIDVMESFLEQEIADACNDDSTQTLLIADCDDDGCLREIDTVEVRRGNTLVGHRVTGLLHGGKYGATGQIRSILNGDLNYEKGTDEADTIPFYFNMYIPLDRNEGVLILQTFGTSGIKTAFTNEIFNFLKSYHQDLSFDVVNFAPREIVLQQVELSIPSKVRVVKYYSPIDEIDEIGEQNEGVIANEFFGKVETVYHLGGVFQGAVRGWLREGLQGVRAFQDIIEFEDQEYDELKVEMKIRGGVKTLNLDKVDNFNCSINVTDTILFGENGHPVYESIEQEGNDLLNGFANIIGIIDLN